MNHKENVGVLGIMILIFLLKTFCLKAKLNVFIDVNGSRLYDINKISQVDARSYEGYGSSEIIDILDDSNQKVNLTKKDIE